MKTKTRVILSAITGFLYTASNGIYKVCYSPITAKAAANSLSDNPQDYFMAKFIRDGGVEYFLLWIALLALFLIWIGFLSKNKQTNDAVKNS